MDIYFTSVDRLGIDLDPGILGAEFEELWANHLRSRCRTTLHALGINKRVPFVLGLDAEYHEVASRLLRTLSGLVQGRTTMEGYGRHAFRFLAWALRRPGGLKDLTASTMVDYHRHRRNIGGLTPRAWNTEAAAVKRFLDAAVIDGLILSNPCAVPGLAWYDRGASVAAESPKFITLMDFRRFRDEGLARGRYGLRNIAMANLLLTSGLRHSEANSLQLAHFAKMHASARTSRNGVTYYVPAAIAKGGRARTTRVSRLAVDTMAFYRDVLRADIVGRASDRQDYSAPPELWVSQNATPMTPSGWNHVFHEASLETGIHATLHTMRHTFAVYLLSRLIKLTIGSMIDAKNEARRAITSPGTIYESLFGDPLRKVQKLLGHASYETTFIYLDVLAENDLVTDDALSVFAEVMDAEEDYANATF